MTSKAGFDWADTLLLHVRALHLPEPQREYPYGASRGRRWRFDLAWEPRRLACEINGSEWVQGRHSRGAGMAADFEKLNAAMLDGWKVLLFTGSQVRNGYAIQILEKALTVQ